MTDAKITDLTEYRHSKIEVEYFATWSDLYISSRYNMLAMMRRDGVDPREKAFAFVFKKGYDPVGHLEDNIDTLLRECKRRGVEVKSV